MTCSPLAARHSITPATPPPSSSTISNAPATRQPSTPRSKGTASATVRQRNQRVEAYRELVRPIALHYAGLCREGADDLIQVGLMGLIRAAERFDPSTGTPFSAFARQHVRGAILHYLRDQAPAIRLPRRQQELQDRVRQFSRDWQTRIGQRPSEAELRCGLQLSVAQWCTFERLEQLRRLAPLEASMEGMPADYDGSGDSGGGDGGGDGGAAEAMALLPRLESRQRQVVEQVVLEGQSLREAARRLQLSPMTVHRALRKGLERLRQELDRGVQQVIPPAEPHRAASASPGC